MSVAFERVDAKWYDGTASLMVPAAVRVLQSNFMQSTLSSIVHWNEIALCSIYVIRRFLATAKNYGLAELFSFVG